MLDKELMVEPIEHIIDAGYILQARVTLLLYNRQLIFIQLFRL